jgi:hypothetical protein
MKLRISRSQKQGGMIGKHVTFSIDARAELTPEEADDVHKYELGKQVIYSSQRARQHLDKTEANLASGTGMGSIKALASLAMAKLSLNMTIDSLMKGHHIEAKDLDEVLGAEEALHRACENMRAYLNTAATFDGREQVVEF